MSARKRSRSSRRPAAGIATQAPPKTVPTPEATPAAAPMGLDVALAVLAVVLAFLLASTPARNSDVFLHLATGRAVADGSWRFGPDPFLYTAGSGRAVIHSWLYDLSTYGLYRLAGGPGLVVFKALLVAGLAVILVVLGSNGRRGALSAACAALAVVAAGTSLPLQPVCVSLLLLALTLLLLRRAAHLRGTGAGWWKAYQPLLLLFALWVNVDSWFLLGPVTVLLYLLGEILGAARPQAPDLRGLALLVPAALAACLINPWFAQALTLPNELALPGALRQDPAFRALFLSPFQGQYWQEAGSSAAGAALALLAVGSVLSFIISPQGQRSWRLPVWGGFFLLACWRVQTAAFFAVVAGPVLALNLADFLTRRAAAPRQAAARVDWALAGRQFAVVVGLLLLAAAWPGWLQDRPFESRGWKMVSDPSLARAAEKICQWRKEGRLSPEARGFLFSPEAADYFAWYCPAEKGFLNARRSSPAAVCSDFVAARKSLLSLARPEPDLGYRNIFQRRHIDHLVLFDPDYDRLAAVYKGLLRFSPEWPLVCLEGHTLVFWNDPQRTGKAGPRGVEPLNLDERAFHRPADEQAPAQGPAGKPQPPAWWEIFFARRPPPSPDRDEAALHLMHFDLYSAAAIEKYRLIWTEALATGCAGLGASAALGPGLCQGLELHFLRNGLGGAAETPSEPLTTLALETLDDYLAQFDYGPPGLPLLAVRACRRAVRDNPDDAEAYLTLAEAYLRLARGTHERAWPKRVPCIGRLREVQAAAALYSAVQLRPDLAQAHAGLASLFFSLNIFDLALIHQTEMLRLMRAGPRPADQTPQQWNKYLDDKEAPNRGLAREVQARLERLAAQPAGRSVKDRARAAAELGLGGKALDLLLASNPAELGRDGLQRELELLLLAGRAADVRESMNADFKQALGAVDYHLFAARAAAACGDYEQADAALQDLFAELDMPLAVNDARLPPRSMAEFAVAQATLLGCSPQDAVPARLATLLGLRGSLPAALSLQQLQANTLVLRGLVALEWGNMVAAEDFFCQAQRHWSWEPDLGLDFGGRLPAVRAQRAQNSAK